MNVGTGSSALPDIVLTQSGVVISVSPSFIKLYKWSNAAGPNKISSALADIHRQPSSGEIVAVIVVAFISL
jgi:stage V sporulation protein SpoVS